MANYLWYQDVFLSHVFRVISTGKITSFRHDSTVHPTLVHREVEPGVILTYTNSSLLQCYGTAAGAVASSYDLSDLQIYLGSGGQYAASPFRFHLKEWHEAASGTRNGVSLSQWSYNNSSIPINSAAKSSNTDDCFIYAYEVEIEGIPMIYFSSNELTQAGMGLIGVGISRNMFEHSVEQRYTGPTNPDIGGGYGTGETPSGEQDGTTAPSGGYSGGDHITVYPPNVSVDVVVNMPEPDKPVRGQPFGNGINMARIDDNAFLALTDALWGRNQTAFDDLWVPFKNYYYNPIEAVVTCFRLPYCFISQLSGSTGSISIAGTLIDGFTGTRIISPSMVTADWVVTGITQFNSWEDFEGVTVRAYAPYIGWFELDPSLCFGVSDDHTRCSITFSYTCDCSNGNLFLEIWANSVGKGDTQTHEAPIAFGSGNCAYPVMLSSNDLAAGAAAKGLAGMGVGAITTAVGAAMGNPALMAGGFLGMVGSGLNAVGNSSQHTTTVGSMTGAVGCLGYLVPFVEVIKPRYVMPEHHNKVYGRPSYAGSIVEDFAGHYAELDVHCDDIDFANDWEQQKIIEMLARGVHV